MKDFEKAFWTCVAIDVAFLADGFLQYFGGNQYRSQVIVLLMLFIVIMQINVLGWIGLRHLLELNRAHKPKGKR